MKKILLGASSSGGHIYPLLGLKKILKKDYECTFLGIKGEMEEKIYPKNSLFLPIQKSFKKNLKGKSQLKKVLFELENRIKEFDLCISGGGFISYIFSKVHHQVPLFLLEQNRILGDANLFAGLHAKKIFASLPIKHNPYFYKTILTGNPSFERFDKEKINRDQTLITFVFGSLSSKTLLNKTLMYLTSPYLDKNYHYLLLTSFKVNNNLDSSIEVLPFLDAYIYLQKSGLVFSRAGATSLYEILKYQTPSILIPSPYVKHHHQEKNATYFQKQYHFPIIKEKDYGISAILKAIQNREMITKNLYFEDISSPSEKIKKVIDETLS